MLRRPLDLIAIIASMLWAVFGVLAILFAIMEMTGILSSIPFFITAGMHVFCFLTVYIAIFTDMALEKKEERKNAKLHGKK
ncbi:MAG: hypothetical protein MJ237_09215 [bacterium]|nr:hypothetical protein [bacterium]